MISFSFTEHESGFVHIHEGQLSPFRFTKPSRSRARLFSRSRGRSCFVHVHDVFSFTIFCVVGLLE